MSWDSKVWYILLQLGYKLFIYFLVMHLSCVPHETETKFWAEHGAGNNYDPINRGYDQLFSIG